MKRLGYIRPTFTSCLVAVVLLVQVYGLATRPHSITTSTRIYTAGSEGKSAYQIWLDNGHTGTVDDFLVSLKAPPPAQPISGTNGSNGLTIAPIDGINGKDGTPCTVEQDTAKNTTISCGNGISAIIPAPQNGVDGVSPTITFNQNHETCYLEYKIGTTRFFTPLIKDPECFNGS